MVQFHVPETTTTENGHITYQIYAFQMRGHTH